MDGLCIISSNIPTVLFSLSPLLKCKKLKEPHGDSKGIDRQRGSLLCVPHSCSLGITTVRSSRSNSWSGDFFSIIFSFTYFCCFRATEMIMRDFSEVTCDITIQLPILTLPKKSFAQEDVKGDLRRLKVTPSNPSLLFNRFRSRFPHFFCPYHLWWLATWNNEISARWDQ